MHVVGLRVLSLERIATAGAAVAVLLERVGTLVGGDHAWPRLEVVAGV